MRIPVQADLSEARIRFASAPDFTELHGEREILSLGGSLSPDGPHLHIAVSDAAGKVTGGHMGPGRVVRTTAEVSVMLLPGYRFSRETDPATGYKELFVAPAEAARQAGSASSTFLALRGKRR